MFEIRTHVNFHNGRAYCPSCERKKGRRPRQRSLALVPGTDGAYLCHAGCSVEEIRSAIGQPKIPASTNGNGHRSSPSEGQSQTYTDLQVGKFVGLLLNGQTPDAIEARDWLSNRGIPSVLIQHYQLGLMCTPKGIGIPIPLSDGTYSIKTRRFPLNSSGVWHQKGIPALVFFTHNPEGSPVTWLCEGEWDALLLGWQVQEANLPITVATFTCGARSVPPESELCKLPGEVVIFYDRDEAGTEGSQKVAQALQKLGKSARIAQVPCNRVRASGDLSHLVPKGWDISDALLSGFTLTDLQWASSQSAAPTLNSDYHQAMQQMEGILAIEDPGQRLWQLAAFSKQTPFPYSLLQKIYTERQRTLTPFAPVDVQDVITQDIPERQWLIASHISIGSVVLLYADGGVGKSLLAYDLSKAIATGSPWNHFPTLQSRVLIIQTDEPDIDTCERLRIARFEEIGRDKVFIERHWQFSQVNKLKQWVNDYQPRLIVIDSLTSCNRFSELEEKDMTYALALMDMVELASQHQCSVLILHHENKLGGMRGSTAIRNAVSEVWHLKKTEAKESFGPLHRLLSIEKSRSGCNAISVIELDPDDNSWRHHGELGDDDPDTQPLSTRLLHHLQQKPGTFFEPDELVLEFPNTNRDQIRKALERWRKQGVLKAEERIKEAVAHPANSVIESTAHLSYQSPCPNGMKAAPRLPFSRLDTKNQLNCLSRRQKPPPAKVLPVWTLLHKGTPIIPAAPFNFDSFPMTSHTFQKRCPARVKPSPRLRLARWTPHQKDTFISTAPSRFDSSLMLWPISKLSCPNGTKFPPHLPLTRLDTPKPAPTLVQTVGAAPSPGSTRLDTSQQGDTHHASLQLAISSLTWSPFRWTPLNQLKPRHTYKSICPNGMKSAPSLPFSRLDTKNRLNGVSRRQKPLPIRVLPVWTRLNKETPIMPYLNQPISLDTARQKDTYQKKVSSVSKPSPHKAFTRWTRIWGLKTCPACRTFSQTGSRHAGHRSKGHLLFSPPLFEFPSPLMLWHTYKNTCPNGTKILPSLPLTRLDTPKSAPTHVQTAEAAPSKGFSRLDIHHR